MNSHFHLKTHVLLIALAVSYSAAGYAANAARIEFASGNVVAIAANGAQRELARGAQLAVGEAIRTGDTGRAQLRFTDGAMMSLQPQTEFRIDDYSYNGKVDGQEKGFFSLIKGGLRTITGLIGKGQRDNYRVNTAVATIGIRGTEYSTVFSGGSDGVLNLSTGEGAVEICNAGGCVIISSGESAVVSGLTPPTKTFIPPKPASTPIVETTKTAFSAVENVSESGRPGLFGADLATGSDYIVHWASKESGTDDVSPPMTAIFGPASKLEKFTDSNGTYAANTIDSAFSIDGVIGWGYWSSGTMDGVTPMTNVHYVAGKPTSDADLTNLSGMTASYRLAGFTTPTSSLGYTGSNVQGSMTVDFSGSSASVNANLSMTVNGTALSVDASGSTSGSASFNLYGSGAGGITANMNGFFAGPNASHAGLTYKIDASGLSLGEIGGAAVYKQNSIAPTPCCPS